MTQIKVGLLGYGLAGSVFHAPLIQSSPDMVLTSIGSRSFDNKSIPDGVKTGSFESVIKDPDIDLIVIATPNTSHFPLAVQAIAQGKHVVIDKPMVIRLAQAETLIDMAAAQGVLLSVFQNRRWDGGFLTAQKLLADNALGEISYAELHYDRFVPLVKKRWRENPIPGAGVLYDLGPHLIDQAYCLFGLPQALTATATHQRKDAIVDDFFHLMLDYGPKKVVLHASSLAFDHGPRITLFGDEGAFQQFGLDGQEDDLKAGKRPGDMGWGVTETVSAKLLSADGSESTDLPVLNGSYESYYNGVASAILTSAALPVLPEEARDTFAMLEAAITSKIEQRTVALV